MVELKRYLISQAVCPPLTVTAVHALGLDDVTVTAVVDKRPYRVQKLSVKSLGFYKGMERKRKQLSFNVIWLLCIFRC